MQPLLATDFSGETEPRKFFRQSSYYQNPVLTLMSNPENNKKVLAQDGFSAGQGQERQWHIFKDEIETIRHTLHGLGAMVLIEIFDQGT